ARMTPDQRVEFGQLLQQRARERHLDLGGLDRSGIKDFQDAQQLARLTGEVHQQPGLLRSILGGGGEAQAQQAGLVSNPLAKAALAGITAMAIQKWLGARSATAAAGAETTAGSAGTIPGGIPGLGSGIPTPPSSQQATGTTAGATTAATARPAGAAAERWHEVVSGDTLWKLA